jgi:carboxypeptidase C (cathepsin A)
VGANLRSSMIKNPRLRVLVCSGYYDLATPHFAADITLSRLDLPPALKKQVWTRYYEGGHMMYHVPAAREQLKRDVEHFLRETLPALTNPDR